MCLKSFALLDVMIRQHLLIKLISLGHTVFKGCGLMHLDSWKKCSFRGNQILNVNFVYHMALQPKLIIKTNQKDTVLTRKDMTQVSYQ